MKKGFEYELVPIDIFADEGPPRSYLTRHPFGRIPAFEHAGFSLYETGAIARYVDEAFDGPKLRPSGARGRARCNQLISVADNYAYPQLVWGIYVERVSKPVRGAVTDEAKITATIPKAEACLKAMSNLMGDNPWLAGTEMTLADLYAAPMFDNLLSADVVTSDGAFLRVSETEHPDLFWALRGGGGNFGVVTSFEFRLHPLGPQVLSGLIVHPFDEATRLLPEFRRLANEAPDELTT